MDANILVGRTVGHLGRDPEVGPDIVRGRKQPGRCHRLSLVEGDSGEARKHVGNREAIGVGVKEMQRFLSKRGSALPVAILQRETG